DAANHSWTQGATTRMSTATACPTDASFHHAGIQAYAGIATDVVPAFSNAFSRFDAPAGTSIASATLDYEFWRTDPYSFTGLQADDSRMLEGCAPNDGHAGCSRSAPGTQPPAKTYYPTTHNPPL